MERLRAALRQGEEHAPNAVRRLPYAAVAAFDGADRGTRTVWAGERLATLLEPRWRDGTPTVITCERVPGAAGGDDALRLAASMLDSDRTTLVELPAPAALRYTDLGDLPEERLRARGCGGFDVNPPQATAAQQRSLAAVVRATRAWARDDHAPAMLTIAGGPGVGKTHLACAAIAERLDAGQRAVFANVPVLLDALRAAVGEDGPARLREWVIGADVLALDDLGAERSTAWGSEQMYEIVNSRYARGASTIITMNRGLETWTDGSRPGCRIVERPMSGISTPRTTGWPGPGGTEGNEQ